MPGDRLRLEVTLGRRRAALARARAMAYVGDQVVAEAELLLGAGARPRPRSTRPPSSTRARRSARGRSIGPHATIGEHVRIGRNCRIGASAVVDGWTEIGDDNEIYPFASIGLIPQDLKFHGEQTRLVIGNRNIFREFVTIHRGTQGGGGVTRIGDRNVFMAYVHVAHDCHVGNDTIFGNTATLGGHVTVEDFANISAGSGVHQFCRVGRHAFIGGYSVVTKDALPFARTVGSRPARIFGTNTIGLMRRGFAPDVIAQAEAVLPLPAAVEAEHDDARCSRSSRISSLACPEVQYLLDFIRTSQRGVILRRAPRDGPRKCVGRRVAAMPLADASSGLIAGNGRFPFLVLDAARGAGHDVTVIAIKEEAFPELEEAAARPPAAAVHWVVARAARQVHQPAEGRRRQRTPSWRGRSSTPSCSPTSCPT